MGPYIEAPPPSPVHRAPQIDPLGAAMPQHQTSSTLPQPAHGERRSGGPTPATARESELDVHHSNVPAAQALLYALGRLVATEINAAELLLRVMDTVRELLGADRGTLYVIDESRGELVSVAAHLPEMPTIRVPIGSGIAGHVARTGELVCIDSCATDSRFWSKVDERTGYVTRNMIAAPVHGSQGDLVGVVQVLNKRDGAFSEDDVATMLLLSNQVGVLLEETTLLPPRGVDEMAPLGTPAEEIDADGSVGALGGGYNRIIGSGAKMQRMFKEIRAAAAAGEPAVLINGEAGSGKSRAAAAVHYNSRRADGPFVVVDCGVQSEALIETQLFGVERTIGAGRAVRSGRCEEANNGTLFLAEVGALSHSAQRRLLNLLETRTVLRVGGEAPVACTARVVAATRKPLPELVQQGRFREDLYYKLRMLPIEVPPLHRRGWQDLRALIDHFVEAAARRHRKARPRIHTDAMSALIGYRWPGNVRELGNCMESAVLRADDIIQVEHLPIPNGSSGQGATPGRSTSHRMDVFTLEPTLRELEARYIAWLLERQNGNRSEVARKLGVGRNTLLRKIKEHGLDGSAPD